MSMPKGPVARNRARQARANSSAAKNRSLGKRARVERDEQSEPLLRREDGSYAAGTCWCGQAYNHPWPGKADGLPHPR